MDIEQLWAPPPDLTVSEWADRYRKLSPESSAEPGQWYTSRAEYQRGIMDALNDSGIETIIVMTSAQIGKTEIINCICGYYIHQDPSPMICLQPTLEMAKTWSKDRLAPMLRDTPVLQGLIKDPRSRDSDNTVLHKRFPGGHITIAGANSAASLASRPVRIVLCDEVDRYPVSAGTEGDPVNLVRKRTTTFWNRKIILTSTPTIKNASRIETAYLASDQRRYFVPCPECGEFILLEWRHLHWTDDSIWYACPHCGGTIDERQKPQMIAGGEWRATTVAATPKTAGFHLCELYSPWVSWKEMRDNFLAAKNFPETLKTWVNTALGETWEETGDGVDDLPLRARAEEYNRDNDLPGVVLVTAGVDVQDDRLECEVVGWGIGEESWSLDYLVLPGDPERADVWHRLDDVLDARFSGEPIRIMFVDSGAHTQAVYRYCRKRQRRRVYAVKGQSQSGKPVSARPARRKPGDDVKPVPIGVDTAKDVIYGRLRIEHPGPGYCHFPDHYPDEYFWMLTAEEIVIRYTHGVPKRVWRRKRPRNEALDCRVYAYAALHFLNPELEVIAKKKQSRRQQQDQDDPAGNQDNPRRSVGRRKKGFVNAWK